MTGGFGMANTDAETVEQIFQGLEARFVPGAVDKERTFYFSIDEHKYTVTVGPDAARVEAGKTVENADCYVKTSEDLFVKMYNGEHYPGVSDFMTGRIKSNNPYLMKTFVDAFSG
jgi:putative sterol carrier protein